MRLLFIHGIGQESFGEAALLTKWSRILVDHGFDADMLASSKPEMAYYGDILDEFSGHFAAVQPMSASADAILSANRNEQIFLAEALAAIGEARGISPSQAEAAAQRAEAEMGSNAVVPMSTGVGRFGVGVLRLLEALSPTLGETALIVLKQAYAYLKKPGVHQHIDERVLPRLGTGKLVIVAHSLGTIIAFRLLRELSKANAQLKVPLLITVGAPLAQKSVSNAVGLPLGKPVNVARWENFFDRGDPVTLGKPLTPVYGGGIVDHPNINNQTFNAHSIEGYLNQCIVQQVLASEL